MGACDDRRTQCFYVNPSWPHVQYRGTHSAKSIIMPCLVLVAEQACCLALDLALSCLLLSVHCSPIVICMVQETSASSTAEQSSLDDNQVHHDRPASGASLPSVSDAEVDRLLLIVQLGDSEPSSSDASSAEAAILGLQQELCDEHEVR